VGGSSSLRASSSARSLKDKEKQAKDNSPTTLAWKKGYLRGLQRVSTVCKVKLNASMAHKEMSIGSTRKMEGRGEGNILVRTEMSNGDVQN